MDNQFWTDEDSWPFVEPAGWVFLARAYKKIWKAKFGDSWTGEEPSVPTLEKLNKLASTTWANDSKASDRHDEVILLIAKRAQAGELETGYRMKHGGEMTPCPPDWWSKPKETIRKRFECCEIYIPQMNILHDGDAHLFVSEQSLKIALANLGMPVMAQLPDGAYRSEMMLLADHLCAKMIAECEKEGKDPYKDPPTLKTIEGWAKEVWEQFTTEDYVPVAAEAVARVIQPLHARLGRASKEKSKKVK